MCNEIADRYMKIFYPRTSVPVFEPAVRVGKGADFFLVSSSVA